MTRIKFLPVAGVGEIRENQVCCFSVQDYSVVVCKVREEFFAVRNKCSHAQATFSAGLLRGHKLLCPLHGAVFDVRDGGVLSAPAVAPIETCPVKTEGGQILVGIPEPGK